MAEGFIIMVWLILGVGSYEQERLAPSETTVNPQFIIVETFVSPQNTITYYG